MVNPGQLPFFVVGLVFSPILVGIINKTKALCAGRVGPPLLQPYRDIRKYYLKGAVFSRTTTWVFGAGPVVGLAVLLFVAAITPYGRDPALLSFNGDFLVAAYLLVVARFFMVLAALDTGSSFEGMGASREMHFASLAEPVLLLALGLLGRKAGGLSLSAIAEAVGPGMWAKSVVAMSLAAAAILIVLLCENARIPFDDPNTHLELTMVHEVMVLDHSGPDFSWILYIQSLKLWIFSSLFVGLLIPYQVLGKWFSLGGFGLGMVATAVVVGLIESTMARLRLAHVPKLLIGSLVLSALAMIMEMR